MPMHPQTESWVRQSIGMWPGQSGATHVVEIGSRIMNLDNHDPRPVIRALLPSLESYVGIDAWDGEGVDVVCLAHDYKPMEVALSPSFGLMSAVEPFVKSQVDLVLCLLSLEHDPYWEKTLQAALSWLRPGGMLVVVCAGEGMFPHEHNESPIPGHYRNVSSREVMDTLGDELVMIQSDIQSETTRREEDGSTKRYEWTRTRVVAWVDE